MTNFGVRTGGVWRGERQLAMQFNANRPYSAFNVPVTVPDPGSGRRRGNGDDGASIAAFNLAAENLALPVVNTYDNVPGDCRLLHVGGHRDQAHEQPMVGPVLASRTPGAQAQEKDYFGQVFRQNDAADHARTISSTPNRTARSSTPTGR